MCSSCGNSTFLKVSGFVTLYLTEFDWNLKRSVWGACGAEVSRSRFRISEQNRSSLCGYTFEYVASGLTFVKPMCEVFLLSIVVLKKCSAVFSFVAFDLSFLCRCDNDPVLPFSFRNRSRCFEFHELPVSSACLHL
jgi:hypothetical protein